MPQGKHLSVTKMKSGQSGKIIEITGGDNLAARLSALGINPGQKLTKISAQMMKGPVTIQAGNTSVALGYGMADKIIVDPE